MDRFTDQDLIRILRSCAGVDEAVDLNGQVLDIPLVELGYDSLAMLEVTSIVQRETGVSIPDDALEYMTTARSTVTYVNTYLVQAGAA